MTFQEIAEHLNNKKIESVRGKKFKGAHVHSIINRKRVRGEKLEREYKEEWSEFSLEVVDKRLVNMFEL